MTIEQLREFVILAEERNYLVAADMLYSTQATLSRHIMAMEKELGFALFTRSTKRIELTQEGSRFLVYARRAMKLQDEYLAELEFAKRSMADSLTVGYNALASFSHFSETLTQYMTNHPKVPITLMEEDSDDLIKAVLNGTCDIAAIQDDPFAPIGGLDKLDIACDYLDAVLPADHPLAKEEFIDLKQLAGDNFVIGIPSRIPGRIFIESCRHAGFEPKIVREGLLGKSLFTWISGGNDCVGLEWHIPATSHVNDRVVSIPVMPTVRMYTTLIYRKKQLSDTGYQLLKHFASSGISREV